MITLGLWVGMLLAASVGAAALCALLTQEQPPMHRGFDVVFAGFMLLVIYAIWKVLP